MPLNLGCPVQMKSGRGALPKILRLSMTVLLCASLSLAPGLSYVAPVQAAEGEPEMSYEEKEIWCQNQDLRIYGLAYIPDTKEKVPLVIFSHELGNNHEAGTRYAERLAKKGYGAYVFDFCGGSAPGTENRSDGTNADMSVKTEAEDLLAVLESAKTWDFVDPERIYLLGGSQGGLVTILAGAKCQEDIAGMMLMYPALSAKKDSGLYQYNSPEEVPEDVSLFGGWMHVGRKYIEDLWDIDFYALLASYPGKILLLHGDQDATVDLSYSEKATKSITECVFHVIHGGGHEFYGDAFEQAMNYILAYLQS
ncbi:MAG: alpha/beta hydrolase [Blautia sp.]|nr:alpha/beta hydrolase [Blautia sp.]